MKKVLIIGGGFAGLSALQILARNTGSCMVTLVDKKWAFDFLPLLPEIVSGRLEKEFVTNSYQELQRDLPFEFIHGRVASVDVAHKSVSIAGKGDYQYDYLLLASGSETNFYGNKPAAEQAFKIDNLADVLVLRKALEQAPIKTWLIAGGGYTGVEIATHIRRLGKKINKTFNIAIIDIAPVILSTLPAWMRQYVQANLDKLGIGVMTGVGIKDMNEQTIHLTNGISFDSSAVIWTAGVECAPFIRRLPYEKDGKGRLKVDEYLRVNADCYAAGDVADFSYKGKSIPMLSYYAQHQGRAAARNIIRRLKGERLKPYRPLNLGYIVPLANGNGCGRIFGVNLKGRSVLFVHFGSSIYRSFSLKNKMGILKDLFKEGID